MTITSTSPFADTKRSPNCSRIAVKNSGSSASGSVAGPAAASYLAHFCQAVLKSRTLVLKSQTEFSRKFVRDLNAAHTNGEMANEAAWA
jgi:hypothetical protein